MGRSATGKNDSRPLSLVVSRFLCIALFLLGLSFLLVSGIVWLSILNITRDFDSVVHEQIALNEDLDESVRMRTSRDPRYLMSLLADPKLVERIDVDWLEWISSDGGSECKFVAEVILSWREDISTRLGRVSINRMRSELLGNRAFWARVFFSIGAGAIVVATWFFSARTVRARHRRRNGLCEGCGYCLRGLIELRCPECGRRFSSSVPANDPVDS